MLPRNGFVGALITAAALLAGPSSAQAHGHGFGFVPFGVGLGLGLGVGYGLGYGYGYPYYYGPYGYPYRGVAYPYAYGNPYYGYPYAVPYAAPVAPAYPYGYSAGYASAPPVVAPAVAAPSAMAPPAMTTTAAVPKPPAPGISTRSAITAARLRPARTDFVKQGDDAFKTGAYAAAAQAWQHALLDDPYNGILALKAGQALFAAGEYEKAADTVQRGIAALPASQWGSVVRDRAQLYGTKSGDYTSQLQALERAARDQPQNADEQFLLAYQYAFSSRTADATKILDDVLQATPENSVARSLRDTLQADFEPPQAQPPSVPTTVSRKPTSRAPAKSLDL